MIGRLLVSTTGRLHPAGNRGTPRGPSAALLAAGAALVLGLGLAASPATALASSTDVSATQRYVQANYLLTQAAYSRIKSAEAAMSGLVARITAECPRIAYDSPQITDSEQLSNEVIGAIVLTAYHVDVPAGTRFVRETEGLRWSNHGLTSALQGYTSKIRVLTRLAVPNVCADVGAWVSSGYRTLPASTVRFDAQFMPNWVALGELPSGLKPFERPAQRGILARAEHFEYELTEVEANAGVNTWDDIMNTLVLQP